MPFIYWVKSLKDYIKKREKKEGLKNIFLEKMDSNYFKLPKEERLKHLVSLLEKNGFKIKK
jgi:hypothetical protein